MWQLVLPSVYFVSAHPHTRIPTDDTRTCTHTSSRNPITEPSCTHGDISNYKNHTSNLSYSLMTLKFVSLVQSSIRRLLITHHCYLRFPQAAHTRRIPTDTHRTFHSSSCFPFLVNVIAGNAASQALNLGLMLLPHPHVQLFAMADRLYPPVARSATPFSLFLPL